MNIDEWTTDELKLLCANADSRDYFLSSVQAGVNTENPSDVSAKIASLIDRVRIARDTLTNEIADSTADLIGQLRAHQDALKLDITNAESSVFERKDEQSDMIHNIEMIGIVPNNEGVEGVEKRIRQLRKLAEFPFDEEFQAEGYKAIEQSTAALGVALEIKRAREVEARAELEARRMAAAAGV